MVDSGRERVATDCDVAVVLGTRPEAIKLVGVLQELGPRARVIHTGQHFDGDLWQAVALGTALARPDLRIDIGGLSRGEQIGLATARLSRYLLDKPVGAMVVQGDTNSTLAGALAGQATGTPVLHVEAGMRSGDLRMPEEMNRLLTDRVSTICCAPTLANAKILAAEGIDDEHIEVTGNTLAEALQMLLPAPPRCREICDHYDLSRHGFVLATMHRAGNVDDPVTLRALLEGLAAVARSAAVVLPLHPHTAARITDYGLGGLLRDIRVLPPLSPEAFLALESAAGLVVTDSGGVQEETALLGVPCLVLRDTTERPELLLGWSRLLGTAPAVDAIMASWRGSAEWRQRLAALGSPYARVHASRRIGRLALELAGARSARGTESDHRVATQMLDRSQFVGVSGTGRVMKATPSG